jgi:hypothetical protein
VDEPGGKPPPLPTRALFWDVDPDRLDLAAHRKFIIERVLEFGRPHDITWLLATYAATALITVVRESRLLGPRTVSYWALHFKIPAEPFAIEELARTVTALGGEIASRDEGTLHAFVDGVKGSFCRYPDRLLEPVQPFRGLQVAAVADIAAMKVVAVSQRGTKKDFFDLFEIFKTISPHQVKGWFLNKYGESRINCYHVLRSLFYFGDAAAEPDPISLNGTTWPMVTSFFQQQEQAWFDELLGGPS